MANTRTPPEVWISAGLRALGTGGPDSVRVELLAQQIGVTKGGFYWHFEDRRALLNAVLDAWEKASTGDVIERVEADRTDPRTRLQKLFDIAAASEVLSRADLAVRLWAQQDADVAQRLQRIDTQRMDYLRSLFSQICDSPEDVESRSMLTASMWIASQLMYGDQSHYTRGQVVEMALRHLSQ
jgi:AcrR family transcriptional regulator